MGPAWDWERPNHSPPLCPTAVCLLGTPSLFLHPQPNCPMLTVAVDNPVPKHSWHPHSTRDSQCTSGDPPSPGRRRRHCLRPCPSSAPCGPSGRWCRLQHGWSGEQAVSTQTAAAGEVSGWTMLRALGQPGVGIASDKPQPISAREACRTMRAATGGHQKLLQQARPAAKCCQHALLLLPAATAAVSSGNCRSR